MNSSRQIQKRNRLKLILVAAIFLVPMLIAVALGMAGWHPGTKSHGRPILPQRSFADVPVALAAGGQYAWRDTQPRMTLIALPGPGCARRCVRQLALMRNARITLNEKQDRLRLLYLGRPPQAPDAAAVMHAWTVGRDTTGKLERYRPHAVDSVSAVLVESNGTALTWYPARFDANGLSQDLHKVLR